MSEIYFREFCRMQDGINERDQKIAKLQTELSNEEWINEQNRKEIDRLNEQIKASFTSEIYFREFYRMQDEIHDLNSVIGELRTELKNEEWINEQNRKEIDRLNEQVKASFMSADNVGSAQINIKQVEHHIDQSEEEFHWGAPNLVKYNFDILADVTIGGEVYEDVKLDWLNNVLENLSRTRVQQYELAAELRLDLEKARAEIHRLNDLLDKREESAYTAMSEREKAEELRNELAELKADYEQLMTFYTGQRGSNRHMEAHIESLKEDLSTVEVNYEAVKSAYRDASIDNRELRRDLLAAQEQRDNIQRKHDELVTQLEELVKENDEY